MTLILTNIIQDMILNNIQEIFFRERNQVKSIEEISKYRKIEYGELIY